MTTKSRAFWQSVSELAAARVNIPEERRALSGVRRVLRLDSTTNQTQTNDPEPRPRSR
jgi:hypothetical protein